MWEAYQIYDQSYLKNAWRSENPSIHPRITSFCSKEYYFNTGIDIFHIMLTMNSAMVWFNSDSTAIEVENKQIDYIMIDCFK